MAFPNETVLSDEVRAFIVTALACFDTPSMVVEAVKEEFDLVVTRQNVQGYDPTKAQARNLAKKWRELFESTRKAFLAETLEIPIANRATRLRSLNRMATKAEKMQNLALAAQMNEQAAKEMGGAFTNRRELGLDGTVNVGAAAFWPGKTDVADGA